MAFVRLLTAHITATCLTIFILCVPASAQTLPVTFDDGSAGIAATPTVLSVTVDFAMVLRIDASINAIAVGNAAIADATVIDPNTLILTGHTAGTTNLIAIDETGTVILDMMVRVGAQKPGTVIVRRGTQRETGACASGNCSGEQDNNLTGDASLIPASAP